MTTIMLAIRRRHINNICSGKKKWEIRRSKPKREPRPGSPIRVLLCQTGTNGNVVGEFECPAIIELKLVEDALIARMACVTVDEVRDYRKLDGEFYAWVVENEKLYQKPSHITDWGLRRVPQSWRYV